MDLQEAWNLSVEQLNYCYNPYSKFSVGAALHSKDGTVYGGCNIENASYGGTVCAERTAFLKAVSEGTTDFSYIIIATETQEPAPPCAFCLQVMAEFCDEDFEIHLANRTGIIKSFRFDQLLPYPFSPKLLDAEKEKA
ncbi:MAG: cytidine deaminase [Candidatus Cloacimonetes bacterium]|nr:cytidine deaminase [Candidatus Cloacimonadota bacterium]